jgi:hypothetical protein
MCHNGEINTTWQHMHVAREELCKVIWRRHQKLSQLSWKKIRFSFNGYGNRIVTDDRSLARSHDDGSPSLGKHLQTHLKKAFTEYTLWNLGMVHSILLQMVTSLSYWIEMDCVLLVTLNQKWFRNYVFRN